MADFNVSRQKDQHFFAFVCWGVLCADVNIRRLKHVFRLRIIQCMARAIYPRNSTTVDDARSTVTLHTVQRTTVLLLVLVSPLVGLRTTISCTLLFTFHVKQKQNKNETAQRGRALHSSPTLVIFVNSFFRREGGGVGSCTHY